LNLFAIPQRSAPATIERIPISIDFRRLLFLLDEYQGKSKIIDFNLYEQNPCQPIASA
jgi:hypothetical protein